MVETRLYSGNREEDYQLVLAQAESLWEADLPLVSNLANQAALLKQFLERTNWVGFYLWEERTQQLVLGPFQGLPACTRIALGRGVCGTAVQTRRTQLVPDVHRFPGHIACDSASQSEIVVPLVRGSECLGVLDIDSPVLDRFDAVDQRGLEAVAAIITARWPAVSPAR